MADIINILDIYSEYANTHNINSKNAVTSPRTTHSIEKLIDRVTAMSPKTILFQKDVRKKLFSETVDNCIFSHTSDIDQESEDNCASSISICSASEIDSDNDNLKPIISMMPDHSLTRAIGMFYLQKGYLST